MKRLTTAKALDALKRIDSPFMEVFRHGSLRVEIYRPDKIDHQQAHTRDEIYVIASGSGYFINGEQSQKFETGEVLFVPAGTEHRFESFTEDFSTWVFFYGPEGGEQA